MIERWPVGVISGILWTYDARIEFRGSSQDCQLTFERYCTFGESLELVDMVVPSYFLALDDEVVGTFFQVGTFNSTVTNLKLLKSTKVTNRLSQALSEKNSHSSLDFAEGTNSGPQSKLLLL